MANPLQIFLVRQKKEEMKVRAEMAQSACLYATVHCMRMYAHFAPTYSSPSAKKIKIYLALLPHHSGREEEEERPLKSESAGWCTIVAEEGPRYIHNTCQNSFHIPKPRETRTDFVQGPAVLTK